MHNIFSHAETSLLRTKEMRSLINALLCDTDIKYDGRRIIATLIILWICQHPSRLSLKPDNLANRLAAYITSSFSRHRAHYSYAPQQIAEWMLKNNLRILLTVNLINSTV